MELNEFSWIQYNKQHYQAMRILLSHLLCTINVQHFQHHSIQLKMRSMQVQTKFLIANLFATFLLRPCNKFIVIVFLWFKQ